MSVSRIRRARCHNKLNGIVIKVRLRLGFHGYWWISPPVRAITEVIRPPPWSIDWLVTVVHRGGSFGVVLVLAALAVVARRWEIARRWTGRCVKYPRHPVWVALPGGVPSHWAISRATPISRP